MVMEVVKGGVRWFQGGEGEQVCLLKLPLRHEEEVHELTASVIACLSE